MGEATRQVPVVALGASAGGVDALARVVAGLPAGFPAAVLVVLHMAPAGLSVLPEILTRAGVLPASHAVDRQVIEAGRIYVAPPDRHLELAGDALRVTRGPRENGVRPSVDTLFRSVARSHPGNAVAVVLSGTLDDGTSGMIAVRDSGGRTMVQDPDEADFAGMPASAMRFAEPEFVARLDDLPSLLTAVIDEGPRPVPIRALDPLPSATDVATSITDAPPSAFTCPECGGTLFEKQAHDVLEFRCRVGHGYTGDSLLAAQHPHLESALYGALVALEERADLSRRMARRMEQREKPYLAARYWAKTKEAEYQASVVRDAVRRMKAADDDEVDG